MRISVDSRLVMLAVAGAAWLTGGMATAQDVCRGDVDGDGQVTVADVLALPPFLYAGDVDQLPNLGADANANGVIDAADFVAILLLNGMPCAATTATESPTQTSIVTPTPTRTPTITVPIEPSVTRTPTRPTATPTQTETVGSPTATTTPTATCVVQSVSLGSVDGELTAADCQREFNGEVLATDVYQVVGTPGQALMVNVTATSSSNTISPFVAIIDPNGQFDRVDGVPPAEWVVTTTQPYLIYVSTLRQTPEFGPYRLTVSSRPCPTPRAININLGVILQTKLDTTSCPDPGTATTLDDSNPADLYTFTVTQPPTDVLITMRQLLETDDIDPAFSIIGPDGDEVVTTDQVDDSAPGGFGLDAQGSFLALQPGTYTIIAQGGIGRYSLTVLSPQCLPRRALTNIPSDRPLVCPGQPGPGCSGTLYGDPARATCGAPLPIPGISPDVPEVNAGADLYTFIAHAGDVISVELDVPDDDAHLFLLGPSSAGNPLVAQDDDMGPVGAGPAAQLAATLALPGTYTIVAANNSALLMPDPADPTDPGDVLPYTLYVQQCPVAGTLSLATGAANVNGSFSISNCVGYGGVPFATYSFAGTAGQFVTAGMSSAASGVDPFVRIIGPDGSVVENDSDLFNPLDTNARANRLLPLDGMYFVEVSTALDQGAVDTSASPHFTLQARRCQASTVSPGSLAGTLQDADCDLGDGRRYDVFAFSAAAPAVASIRAPANGCVVGLLNEGPQLPGEGCSRDLIEFPMIAGGTYGFMIAGADVATRGSYTAQLRTCPLTIVGYGDQRAGTITGSSCAAADGALANWYFVRAVEGLVQFNDGISGSITASFPLSAALTDLIGRTNLPNGFFSDDPDSLIQLGPTLGALIRVTGSTPGDQGSYNFAVDQAEFRQ